jgi:hypothetical protein
MTAHDQLLDAIFALYSDDAISAELGRSLYLRYANNRVHARHLDLFPKDEINTLVTLTIVETGEIINKADTRDRYTDADIATLTRLYARGKKYHEIARALDRSFGSVVQKINTLQKSGVLPARNAPRIKRETESAS